MVTIKYRFQGGQDMNINNSQFLSNLQIQEALFNSKSTAEKNINRVPSKGASFEDVLNRKLEEKIEKLWAKC